MSFLANANRRFGKIAVAAGLALVAASAAGAQSSALNGNGRCVLVVDGATYIDGSCIIDLQANGDFDFDDGRLKTECAEFDLGPDECSMANTRVMRNGTFGSLSITGPDAGIMFWNEGRYLHGQARIGNLHRRGACWQNDRARLCAYR
ncbi:hypothetical protein GGD81_002358 [Rhodobium orientis]|uniref:Beta/gamma crystallin 'Greek key' domain-containing protein n=1 Tax=Rhodobium orientis TaxID=34017 RepID=A0A327JXH8_9HYPH|nr:hypothetical protein [Rhodobium orientis]MBB4303315.1 hypothetical protein [Rhodobium orientis]MBK5951590.1 hypothetical protein [Rhodobium orientis]RAI27798.1 hypothetical protein CH339_08740 [Rhodobium orientis]